MRDDDAPPNRLRDKRSREPRRLGGVHARRIEECDARHGCTQSNRPRSQPNQGSACATTSRRSPESNRPPTEDTDGTQPHTRVVAEPQMDKGRQHQTPPHFLSEKKRDATPNANPPVRTGAGGKTGNDPSAGSPTETLLRLLLPLNDKVWTASRGIAAGEPAALPQSGGLTGSFNR